MKKLSMLIGLLSVANVSKVKDVKGELATDMVLEECYVSSYQELVDALVFVESSGNPLAHNVKSGAVGCLQILPIMVREVNRILDLTGGDRTFQLEDRWDCDKSKQMFDIWADYHHCYNSYEHIARNWNGGPKGITKSATEEYWERVKKYLSSNE
jgi:hypothetical protein